MNDFPDATLKDTLSAPDAPPVILTTRHDGTPVYVELDADGEVVEHDPLSRTLTEES